MSKMGTNDTANMNASADQSEGAAQAAADKRQVEKAAAQHRNQIRSMAQAAVQAMVTSHRDK